MKRTRIKIGSNSKRKPRNEIVKRTISSGQYFGLINSKFHGSERIGAIKAAYETPMGDDIEIYEIGSDDVVGAIHPDGATMIIGIDNWKLSGHKCEPEGDVPYNVLFRIKTKKRRALQHELDLTQYKKRRRKKIRTRVALKSK